MRHLVTFSVIPNLVLSIKLNDPAPAPPSPHSSPVDPSSVAPPPLGPSSKVPPISSTVPPPSRCAPPKFIPDDFFLFHKFLNPAEPLTLNQILLTSSPLVVTLSRLSYLKPALSIQQSTTL